MNDWIDQIIACGFGYDLFFTVDGDKTIVLHWREGGFSKLKVFREIDADQCLADALQFAQNFDAYVNTAAPCAKI